MTALTRADSIPCSFASLSINNSIFFRKSFSGGFFLLWLSRLYRGSGGTLVKWTVPEESTYWKISMEKRSIGEDNKRIRMAGPKKRINLLIFIEDTIGRPSCQFCNLLNRGH